jgi:hypothetical protein
MERRRCAVVGTSPPPERAASPAPARLPSRRSEVGRMGTKPQVVEPGRFVHRHQARADDGDGRLMARRRAVVFSLHGRAGALPTGGRRLPPAGDARSVDRHPGGVRGRRVPRPCPPDRALALGRPAERPRGVVATVVSRDRPAGRGRGRRVRGPAVPARRRRAPTARRARRRTDAARVRAEHRGGSHRNPRVRCRARSRGTADRARVDGRSGPHLPRPARPARADRRRHRRLVRRHLGALRWAGRGWKADSGSAAPSCRCSCPASSPRRAAT